MKLYYFSSGPRERILQMLIDNGYDVLAVIATSIEKTPKVETTLQLAKAHGIPVQIVSKNQLPALAKTLEPCLYLSAGFAYIFPPSVLKRASLCLNVHGTLLPKYRGANTLYGVLKNNDKQSGVTIHKIDEDVDTGPILLQQSFPVSKFDTLRSLQQKTLLIEPEILKEALCLLEQDSPPDFKPQVQVTTSVNNMTPDYSKLDPAEPLNRLYDKIRSVDSERFPCYFEVDGEKVYVKLSRDRTFKKNNLDI